MMTMTQNEYESMAEEGIEDLRSELPSSEVELKKVSLDTSQEESV